MSEPILDARDPRIRALIDERDALRSKLALLNPAEDALADRFITLEASHRLLLAKLDASERAREGMVPVEDVWPLVNSLRNISMAGNAGMPDLPRREDGALRTTKVHASEAIQDFRAKHPNLFKK